MLSRLVYCSKGDKVKLENINGGRGAGENVKNLGLSVGDLLEVADCHEESGPVELQNNGRAILVGRELASKLIVETNKDY